MFHHSLHMIVFSICLLIGLCLLSNPYLTSINNKAIELGIKMDEIGRLRWMTERALKESYISLFDPESVFTPTARFDELHYHFNTLITSGTDELMVAQSQLESMLALLKSGDDCPNRDHLCSVPSLAHFIALNDHGEKFINIIHQINSEVNDKYYNHVALFLFGCIVSTIIIIIMYYYCSYQYQYYEFEKKIQFQRLQKDLEFAEKENTASQLTLSQVCHEMKGHMAVVMMALDTALDDAKSYNNQELIHLIGKGKLAANEQSNVLQNRMEMHKVLCGDFKPNRESIDAVLLANEIIRIRGDNIVGIDIKFECEYESLWIYIDICLVDRVLNNLLSNALKNTREGNITVSLDMKDVEVGINNMDDNDIAITQKKEIYDKILQIRVRDTGIGIDLEDQAALFTKDVDKKLAPSQQSTTEGLGLFFVKKIALILGGDVKLEESILGQGSSFLVWFATTMVPHQKQKKSATATSTLSANHGLSLFGNNKTPVLKESMSWKERFTTPGQRSLFMDYKMNPDKKNFLTPFNSSSSSSSFDAMKNQHHDDDDETTKHLLMNINCLLVDDQKIIRLMMKKKLTKIAQGFKWKFVEASTAEHAIAFLKEEKKKQLKQINNHTSSSLFSALPTSSSNKIHSCKEGLCIDVITMDENMEGQGGRLKGTEAIVKLRQKLKFDGIIIGLSGDATIGNKQIKNGADLFWGKPLPSEDIIKSSLFELLYEKKRKQLWNFNHHQKNDIFEINEHKNFLNHSDTITKNDEEFRKTFQQYHRNNEINKKVIQNNGLSLSLDSGQTTLKLDTYSSSFKKFKHSPHLKELGISPSNSFDVSSSSSSSSRPLLERMSKLKKMTKNKTY